MFALTVHLCSTYTGTCPTDVRESTPPPLLSLLKHWGSFPPSPHKLILVLERKRLRKLGGRRQEHKAGNFPLQHPANHIPTIWALQDADSIGNSWGNFPLQHPASHIPAIWALNSLAHSSADTHSSFHGGPPNFWRICQILG